MNSPSIAIVKWYKANNADIKQAQTELKTPEQVKYTIDTTLNYTGYEIVPDEGELKPYLDWDCELPDTNTTDYEEMKRKVRDEALSNAIELGFPEDKIYWSSRHGRNEAGNLKVSWRATVVGMKTTKATMKKLTQDFRNKHYNTYLQEHAEGNKNHFKTQSKSWLDIGVYTSNRKMGLVGCVKKYPEDPRRLKSDGEYPHHYTLIGCVDKNDETFNPPDEFNSISRDVVANISDEDTTSQTAYESICGQEYIEDLVKAGFTSIHFLRNGYEFKCKQMERGVLCPCCGGDHTSNHYRVYRESASKVSVKSFSDSCCPLPIRDDGFLFDVPDSISQVGTDTNDTEYEVKKRHFEEVRQVAMIEQGLLYIVDDEHYLNRKDLIETFQDYLVDGKKGKRPFTEMWLRDQDKQKYKKMDFLPQGAPGGVYNLWRGYTIDSNESDPSAGNIKPFKQLIEALTSSKEGENAYDYMLKWIALMFQKPHEKTRVCIVIRSEEGIGKNTLFWYIGEKLMGNNLFKETNDPEHDLFAEHTNAMERRKLVVLDEADIFRYHNKICPLITNMETRVRKMYMNPTTISNYTQIAILSNNSVPVKISPSDRRYVVFDGNTDLKDKNDFWTNFYDDWSCDPVHQKAVHDYLMKVDLEGFDFWKERPITDAYREIRSASLPNEIKFLVHFITEAFPVTLAPPGADMRGYDLYQVFDNFSPSSNETNAARFGTRLRNFLKTKGVYSEGTETRNIFHKSRGANGVVWQIDRLRAFEWLQFQNFTSLTELPPPISYRNSHGDFDPSKITKTF